MSEQIDPRLLRNIAVLDFTEKTNLAFPFTCLCGWCEPGTMIQ